MSNGTHQKSTYAIWQNWAKVLQRQMARCVTVYKEHSESEAKAQKILDRLELFIDPIAHAQQLAKQNYDVKGGTDKLCVLSITVLQKIFRDTLDVLPEISEDMQRLLNSSCYGNCSGRQAMDIFKGPHRTDHEGIGAGLADVTGFLPWMLAKLLDDADVGGDEYLYRGLGDTLSDEDSESAGGPMRERSTNSFKPRKKETLTGIS